MNFFRFVPNPVAAALKKRSVGLSGLTREEAIEAAAENIGRLADDYRSWLEAEIVGLRTLCADYRTSMANAPDAYASLRSKIEDIRDTAGSFGFDIVTEVADSFSRVLMVNRPDSGVYAEAVDLHMNTLMLLALPRAEESTDVERAYLLEGLRQVVDRLGRI